MTYDLLFAYVVTATLLTMVPGLDTASVLRAAAVNGARHGVSTSLGVAAGCFCWGTMTAAGLSRLIQEVPAAGNLLRIGGALYLGWLGAQLLLRPRTQMVAAAGDASGLPLSHSAWRGFATNMLNPKVAIFYLTLLPQFAPGEGAAMASTWLLAIIHVLIALAWFVLLSFLAGGVRSVLSSPRAYVVLDRASGGLFLLLGAGMVHAVAVPA